MKSFPFTESEWQLPHFANPNSNCDCAAILADGYCGAIAQVYIDNGLRICEGGNDCPPLEEAKANARLLTKSPNLFFALYTLPEDQKTPEIKELIRFIIEGHEKTQS